MCFASGSIFGNKVPYIYIYIYTYIYIYISFFPLGFTGVFFARPLHSTSTIR